MNLELKRLESQLLQVKAARSEQELRILERMEEIKRLEAAVVIQKTKEEELENKIKSFGG
jgi:hypothetical protein